jgi:putative transposase
VAVPVMLLITLSSALINYIHQNPMKANLVRRMEDWEMSSFRDYDKFRQGTICNKKIAYELLEIPESADLFLKETYNVRIIKKSKTPRFP